MEWPLVRRSASEGSSLLWCFLRQETYLLTVFLHSGVEKERSHGRCPNVENVPINLKHNMLVKDTTKALDL